MVMTYFAKFVPVSKLKNTEFKLKFDNLYKEIRIYKESTMSQLYLFFVRRLVFVTVMQIDILSVRIAALLTI